MKTLAVWVPIAASVFCLAMAWQQCAALKSPPSATDRLAQWDRSIQMAHVDVVEQRTRELAATIEVLAARVEALTQEVRAQRDGGSR